METKECKYVDLVCRSREGSTNSRLQQVGYGLEQDLDVGEFDHLESGACRNAHIALARHQNRNDIVANER